jgi:cyclic pyranopterin phosphate synthase
MVDVGEKKETKRVAKASAQVRMGKKTLELVKGGMLKKGDVLSIAQVAGILGAKFTSNLIPLCHPIRLDRVDVKISIDDDLPGILIETEVAAFDKTGVEMEALTGASIAALTIYDMVKSVEKSVTIERIVLTEKLGGKSGYYSIENS